MATAMVDSARSISSVGGGIPPSTMGVVNTETRIGEETLSPVFIKELEHYYAQAPLQDKAKCLELITSVRLGQELRSQVKGSRPKSAMPAFGYTDLNPYTTHYTKEYPPKLEEELRAFRPQTSNGYATQKPEFDHPGPTTYDEEYHQKNQRPASPERAGSASGNRNNRPHPNKAFMVWQFPRKNRFCKSPDSRPDETLTNAKLNQITKRLCSSVYQNDYLGIPQGFQVRSAFNLPSDYKDFVQYGMESNQRETYQQPFQQAELMLPTTRYGANTKKPIPSVAVIPTANKRLMGVNGRTTYDRHFNDNAGPVVEQIRDVGKKLGIEALKKHYNLSTGADKDLIGNMLNEYGGAPSPMAPYAAAPSPLPPSPSPRPPSHCRRSRTHFHRAVTPAGGRAQSVGRATPPAQIRFSGSAVGERALSSRGSTPAYKPRPLLPAATAILLPSQPPMEVQMPTSPVSMPYTPPMFLS